jgi:hypothetical protein
MLPFLFLPAFSTTVAIASAPCAPIRVPSWVMISFRAVSAPKDQAGGRDRDRSSGPTEKVV